ncbi:MAG: hypothetical protein ACXV98_05320 [Ilumatobacteraceae bacterium]
MSLVAVVGDGCTTTSLGIAAAWPCNEPCVVAEFDPAGGCLAAWLDLPRSPGLAEVVASSAPGSWPAIEAAIQAARCGVDVLLAPTRAVEAVAVIHAATASMLPVLGALESPVVVADGGRLRGALSALVVQADVVVIAHRQNSGSCAAAALGFERVAELASLLALRSIPTVIALIGQQPYAADEVADFVDADTLVTLADDSWAAAVLAGRAGSAVRLARSPLMRSCRQLAAVVSTRLRQVRLHDGSLSSVGRLVDDLG